MWKKTIKILIVDDNKDLATTISDYYASHELGIIPLTTSDPTEVLPILSENSDIMVILSDFYMPGMNGLELLLSVREKYPKVLFVLMTGYHTSEIQELGIEQGAIRFFKKPFSMEELTDLIHETIAETISGFEGTIESIQLPDIIQLIGLGHQSVELKLTVDNTEGSMFFDNGEIIHVEYENIKGEEAFYEMFNWVGGQFSVTSITTTVEKTIDQSWQGLLLEAARRQDEAKAVAEGVIAETGSATPAFAEAGFSQQREIEEAADEISLTETIELETDVEQEKEVQEPLHEELEELETAESEQPDEALATFPESDTEKITEAETEEAERRILDERFISEALEAAVEHYIRYWPPDDEKLNTSSLPLHTLPENIRNHFQFRFQQYLIRVIQSDGVPFDFNNEKVGSALQQLLDVLYSTWDVPREKYLEILRYALSFELAHSIDPARAITEVIHEISGGITSEIKLLVQNMIDYKLIGEHYLSLVESISGQRDEEISERSIEYLCRSVILRLDEQERYQLVLEAMRCILNIANTGGDDELEFLDYNVVLNMLETHGLAQVSDYINMTRELGQVSMSIADLDNAMEKFKQRSAGMTYE